MFLDDRTKGLFVVFIVLVVLVFIEQFYVFYIGRVVVVGVGIPFIHGFLDLERDFSIRETVVHKDLGSVVDFYGGRGPS